MRPDDNNWFAWLTPPGRGGVATWAVSGDGLLALLGRRFRPCRPRDRSDASPFPHGVLHYGRWTVTTDPLLEEEVVVVRTDTGQAEVSCHGGTAMHQAIGQGLQQDGFAERPWSDVVGLNWQTPSPFPRLVREAWRQLPFALTLRTARILLDQTQGALGLACEALAGHLAQARTAAALDCLRQLEGHSWLGQRLSQPWNVVITGPPNAGKSSLFNALLGYQRALVRNEPGTTRDVLAGTTAWDGWPIGLHDTAGWRRAPADDLEAAGMARAQQAVLQADLVVRVREKGQSHDALCQAPPEVPQLLVVNKCDLPGDDLPVLPDELPVSALTGHGVEDLMGYIVEKLVPAPPAEGAAVPFLPALAVDLRDMAQAVARGDYRQALQRLEVWR